MDSDRRDQWTTWLIPVALILGLAVLLSLPIGPTAPEGGAATAVDVWLKAIVGYLAAAAEIAAALVIGVAIIRGIFRYIYLGLLGFGKDLDWSESIRLQLGRVLAFRLLRLVRRATLPARRGP